MKINDLRNLIKERLEHPSCKRCGKQFYLPQPPKELYESWGIFSWTAFIKQFAKHKGWHEVNSLSKNLVCPDCVEENDIIDNIILDSYTLWIEQYNKWLKENKLYKKVYNG